MQIPCLDGFLLSPDDPLFSAHTRVNDFLLAEEQRDPSTPFDPRPWKKLPKRDIPSLTLSILTRLRWLDQHDRELDTAHQSRMRLRAFLRVLYSVKADFTEPELRAVLDATTPLLGRIVPYGPVERVAEYLKKNDLTEELCRSLRAFQSGLREEMSESQSSLQSLRQTLHMQLWMDEWEPLDPARCWSECIRRDLRQMTGDRKQKWRSLLKHLRGNAPVRMPRSWAEETRPLLATVGAEDFLGRMEDWFAPFQSGQPLPLSVAGSHVLKCMVWFCAVSDDERVKACALWLLNAKWRQKRNVEKSLVALTELGVTREELSAGNLLKSRAPHLPNYFSRLSQSLSMLSMDRIVPDPSENLFIVQGQLHFYRVLRESGRITRVSDNAILELDWHALPDQYRALVSRKCDSPHQVHLRASMLMQDSVFAQYFRTQGKSNA